MLWYEVNQNEEENDVFIRLNIGKIPLVEAENIKALFLSKNDALDQDDLKERAEFWYETEMKARENRDFRYCVLSKVDEKDIMEDEQEKPVIKDDILRIEAYLRAMTHEKKLFDFFYESHKDGTLNECWEKLKQAIDNLSGFSSNQGEGENDRKIFHYLGFLILDGENLHDIYKEWCNIKNKEEFSEILFKRVRSKVSKPLNDIDKLSYWKDKEALKSLLLLFNLEFLIRQESSNEYFKFNRFVLEKWSLEHIYAQNSESISKSKENNEKIKWLSEVLKYIEEKELKDEIEEAINDIEEEAIEDSRLKELYKKIDENFKTTDDLHCISNLTLLDKKSNSKIGNQIFSKKRNEIQKLKEKDKLIPIATEKVFEKVFSEKKESPDVFTQKDQDDYLKAIQKHLKQYRNDGEGK